MNLLHASPVWVPNPGGNANRFWIKTLYFPNSWLLRPVGKSWKFINQLPPVYQSIAERWEPVSFLRGTSWLSMALVPSLLSRFVTKRNPSFLFSKSPWNQRETNQTAKILEKGFVIIYPVREHAENIHVKKGCKDTVKSCTSPCVVTSTMDAV